LDHQLFQPTEQEALLELLSRGASPAAACRQLGRSIADFFHATQNDPEFRRRVQRVHHALGQNVAAALYKAAMEGSVTAQTFWLRHSPPPGWTGDTSDMTADELEKLSDDELIDLARAHGVALPPEIEATLESHGGEEVSDRVPPKPAADE